VEDLPEYILETEIIIPDILLLVLLPTQADQVLKDHQEDPAVVQRTLTQADLVEVSQVKDFQEATLQVVHHTAVVEAEAPAV
jgi:hypothetical protein